MKQGFTTLSLLALLLFSFTVYGQETQFLTILHLNDTHGNLLPGGPRTAAGEGTVGGIARAASVIQKERAKDQPVLTLHAGDMFTGDPYFSSMLSAPEMQILASLGLDAMTLGNHEFDLTPAALEGAVGMAFGGTGGFPLLAANLTGLPDWSNFPALSQLWAPHVIKTCGTLRVGIFGLTIPSAFSQYAPLSVSDDFVPIAQSQVNFLRDPDGGNCDVVILLSHLGELYDGVVAEYTQGIDIILGGHDHYITYTPHIVNGVIIAQAGAFYRQMGKMRIKVHKGNVQLHQYSLIDLQHPVMEDPVVRATVDYLGSANVPSQMFDYVDSNPYYLEEVAPDPSNPGYHDTPVGSLVADAFLAYTGADLAFEPGGSTAQPIYPGPVLTMDLFRTIGYGFNPFVTGSLPGLPNLFGFPVVTFEVPGPLLLALVDGTLKDLYYDELLLQTSQNVYYQYYMDEMDGNLAGLTVNTTPVDPDDYSTTYTVATNLLVYMYVEQQLTALGLPVPPPTLYPAEYLVLQDYITQNGFPSTQYQQSRILNFVPPVPKVAAASPAGLEISGAYPNPFTDRTTVQFSVPEGGHASLRVYDVTGREVAVLADGLLSAGKYRKSFTATGLPAGMYFCILRVNGTQRSAKLLLTR